MLHHITGLSRGPLNAIKDGKKILMLHSKSLEHIYDISSTNHDSPMKCRNEHNGIRHDVDYVIEWNYKQNRLCDESKTRWYGVI